MYQHHALNIFLHVDLLTISHELRVTCMSDSRRGFGLEIGFIDHLQVLTTNHYSAIAALHTLQITTAHAKSFQFSVSSAVVLW
jgi:hypothetical protein